MEYKLFAHTYTKFDKDSVTEEFKFLHNHQITKLKDGQWSINDMDTCAKKKSNLI